MNRKIGLALLVLGASAPTLLAAQAPPDSTEREVLLLHREINEAMFRGDPEPLAQAAVENLVVVPPGGYPETKAQVIRGTQNFHIDSVSYSEREVRVQGSTAVVTAKVMLYGELLGIDPATGQGGTVEFTGRPSRQMSVFVKEQGRWRLLAQSSTPIRLSGDTPQRAVDQAQPDAAAAESVAAIEREVREALEAEQRAFVAGECVAATFFSDDPFLFVVGGRTIQIKEAPAGGRVCESRAANQGTRPRRTTERHDVHVLGPTTAYTVTHYANQVTQSDGTTASYPSVVTKIWARQGDTWRIVHFHESSGQAPSP